MRTRHLLVVGSFLALAGCGPLVDLPEVGAAVHGPATLAIGAQAQYQATLSPIGGATPTSPSSAWAFRWETSEPGIATVSSTGMVTAVALGRVTISAVPVRGSERGFAGTISVTVQ